MIYSFMYNVLCMLCKYVTARHATSKYRLDIEYDIYQQ